VVSLRTELETISAAFGAQVSAPGRDNWYDIRKQLELTLSRFASA